MRLSFTALLRRWPIWLTAIAWALLLACLPWWVGLPLLVGFAATQAAQLPRLHRYVGILRSALRWGLVGVLVAGYRAIDGHALALTLMLLAALVGFSLLVLLESWQDRKPLRNAAIAAASPEWHDMALAPIGPAAAIIELQPPVWFDLDSSADGVPIDVTWTAERNCRIGARARIEHIEPRICMAPGQDWLALPITADHGVVLYDRVHDRQYRLRGWQLYGWGAGEAWLSRSDDQPPLALSHVLGQDQVAE